MIYTKESNNTARSINSKEVSARFEKKNSLSRSQIHEFPRARKTSTLNHLDRYSIEVCSTQVKLVMLQARLDGATRPVGRWPSVLIEVKQFYDTKHLQCFSTFWPVSILPLYRESTHFIVRTDHDLLNHSRKVSNKNERLKIWKATSI